MGLLGSCRQPSSRGSVNMLLQTLVTGASVIRRLHPGARSIFVYRSAALETRGRWLAWLVQAAFRGLQRFSSAPREVVAPETVRRTRWRPRTLARLPIPVTIRRPLIRSAAAVSRERPCARREPCPPADGGPSVLPAPATSLQPSPPSAPLHRGESQIDRSKR